MQKQKIIIFTILLILAGSLACTSNLTAETTGQVTNVVLDRDRKTTKRKTSSGKTKKTTKTEIDTEIDYSYAVDGKTYTGFSEKDGDVQAAFRSGSTVKVCYNPKNPEESDVFPLNAKCE
jgi:hypothetical protein